MKLTIVYDNEVKKPRLKADWGFSCLVEVENMPPILFDTGATGSILLHNMRELQINPEAIGVIVLSHSHRDHTGGLHGFNDFKRLEGLSLVCPCHCTQYKSEIMRLFPEKCLECGAGPVIEL